MTLNLEFEPQKQVMPRLLEKGAGPDNEKLAWHGYKRFSAA